MQRSRILGPIGMVWFLLTVTVIAYATRLALLIAPTEATMGNVQRIFYYHVPTSMLSLLFPYVNFAASLCYLYWRQRDPLKALTADAWAIASAEVTVVYASICLWTGMLWGRAAWGIWWTWDARLTTTLVLWLIYVSYLLLRRFAAGPQVQTLAAVLGIFGALDVPIVYMSNRWWRTQHPAPVFGGGQDSGITDPAMLHAFAWNILAWLAWGLLILALRYHVERQHQKFAAQEAQKALNA